jgi:peptidoglycan/xylan/chitin deacetylase (PgdA/CDA1 family)
LLKMATSWKRRAFAATASLAAPLLTKRVKAGQVRILNYHRILEHYSDFTLDGDVISATPELFARQVEFCRRHFDVISFGDLLGARQGRHPLPRRPLIITFDDGYEDNFRNAYAILKQQSVPAMFFLAVDYVDTDRLFWWDEVALAVKTHPDTSLSCRIGDSQEVLDLTTPEDRIDGVRRILKALKSVADPERRRVVGCLSEQVPAALRGRIPPQALTWSQAREMAQGGMEIGSHTLSHPILAQISDLRQLQLEIATSKAIIEAKVERPVSVFSYPVGGQHAITPEVKQLVRRAGYTFAVTYINGVNSWEDSIDPFALQRLHVDGLDEQSFRTRLLFPGV